MAASIASEIQAPEEIRDNLNSGPTLFICVAKKVILLYKKLEDKQVVQETFPISRYLPKPTDLFPPPFYWKLFIISANSIYL